MPLVRLLHAMLAIAARLRSEERGAVLVLVSAGMVALLGVTALTLDAGRYMETRRQLQNAVDAAAHAGARELPDIAAAATVAQQYWDLNEPSFATATFTISYPDGGTSRVRIEAQADVAFLFAPAFGSLTATVNAVVEAQASTSGGYAAASLDGTCDEGVEISGSDLVITGSVHSNSDLEVSGSDISVSDAATYVCDVEVTGGNVTFGSGPTQTGPIAPPVTYVFTDFPCTFSYVGDVHIEDHPELWVNDDPGTGLLRPGVICAVGEIELNAPNVSGNVTFVATEEVEIEGDGFNLTSFFDNILAFAEGDISGQGGEIEISGDNGQWDGHLIALNGEIEIDGSNLSGTGTSLAVEIEISGDYLTLDAGPNALGGSRSISIIE